MAFRDETEALRARVRALEAELREARARVAELEREDVEALRERIDQLERMLGKKAKAQKPRKKLFPARAHKLIPGGIALALAAAAGAGLFDELFDSGLSWEGAPTGGMVVLAEHPFPPPLSASTLGEHSLSEESAGCPGFAPSEPLLVVRAAEATRVQLSTHSSTDLVLFVRTAEGEIFCDDDSGDQANPMLVANLPPGDHRVWVGTYREGASASFELDVDARTAADFRLAPEAEPTLGTFAAEADFPARSLDGRTRGELPASTARDGCPGHVPSQPHAVLEVGEPTAARISARSAIDTVLLVRRPDGSFVCNDDSAGNLDPMLVDTWSPGRHAIWVGTYARGGHAAFELEVRPSALGAARAATPIAEVFATGDSARDDDEGDESHEGHEGHEAPEFDLRDLEGDPVTLSSLRGQVVLVNFWASWCEPCVDEMPVLERLYQRYSSRGFTVVGVAQDRTPATVETYLQRVPVSYPVVHDAGHAIADRYRPPRMPSSYVVDRAGVVRHVQAGFHPGDAVALERAIEAQLDR